MQQLQYDFMPVRDCALAAPGCLKGMGFHLRRQEKHTQFPGRATSFLSFNNHLSFLISCVVLGSFCSIMVHSKMFKSIIL